MQAFERFALLRPTLEGSISQIQLAREHQILLSTMQRWIKRYRIRYNPADLAVIRVFYRDRFLCRAICQKLSGRSVSLKEIEKARSERRKQVRAGLTTRASVVEQYIAVYQEEVSQTPPPEPAGTVAKPRLKRYFNE